VSGLWDSQLEVIAEPDAVVQYASLTDFGLCEDAPNVDTGELSYGLSVNSQQLRRAGFAHERWMAIQIFSNMPPGTVLSVVASMFLRLQKSLRRAIK
jgi:hypothetical protein